MHKFLFDELNLDLSVVPAVLLEDPFFVREIKLVWKHPAVPFQVRLGCQRIFLKSFKESCLLTITPMCFIPDRQWRNEKAICPNFTTRILFTIWPVWLWRTNGISEHRRVDRRLDFWEVANLVRPTNAMHRCYSRFSCDWTWLSWWRHHQNLYDWSRIPKSWA